jgi:hypothetical protein
VTGVQTCALPILEAIYHDCILILHNEWINKGELFISGVNCIGVSTANDLKRIVIMNNTENLEWAIGTSILLMEGGKIIKTFKIEEAKKKYTFSLESIEAVRYLLHFFLFFLTGILLDVFPSFFL